MPSLWHCYIVRCIDSTYYTGVTNDLKSRIECHNSGSGAKYTRSRRPVQLIYQEEFDTRSEALKREAQIKRLPRCEKDALISL